MVPVPAVVQLCGAAILKRITTKRSVLKQRKEKERRKDTAMSSKLLWHLQNLGGDACAAKLFVFQP